MVAVKKSTDSSVFSGDKRTYPSWKAAFLACIDNAPLTAEYKLLQLRQYVSGEALRTIEHLGHSPYAYEAAKCRLERKYGGKRRRTAIFLEDLERFRQVRPDNAEDLEQFADLLDLTVINLEEAGEIQDLENGTLYTLLQRKLPESLLGRYHRWIYESNTTESVVALKKWVMEESHFQIIASETVNGLHGHKNTQADEAKANTTEQLTFFIGPSTCQRQQLQQCQTCRAQHRIWECSLFNQKSKRRDIAKRFNLCFWAPRKKLPKYSKVW